MSLIRQWPFGGMRVIDLSADLETAAGRRLVLGLAATAALVVD